MSSPHRKSERQSLIISEATLRLRALLGKASQVSVRLDAPDLPRWVYKLRVGILAISEPLRLVAVSDDGTVSVHSTGGELQWRFQTSDKVYDFCLTDLDRDGHQEIIAGSGENERVLYALRSNGDVIWRWKSNNGLRAVGAADLDSDGNVEIVVGSEDGDLFFLNATGQLQREVKIGARVRAIQIADIDDDGGLEILIGSDDKYLRVLRVDGSKKWERRFGGRVYGLCAADFNQNGKLEIVAGTQDGNVYMVNSLGEVVWEYSTGIRVFCVAEGDVDNDGVIEILAGTENNYVYIFSPSGTLKWKLEVGNRVRSICVADIDQDGKNELITGLENDRAALFRIRSAGAILADISALMDSIKGLTRQQLGLSDAESELLQGLLDIDIVDENDRSVPELHLDAAATLVERGDAKGALAQLLRVEDRFSLRWSISENDVVYGIGSCDLDGDGLQETILGIGNGHVIVLSADGQMRWKFTANDRIRSVWVGDVDLDGQNEILACSDDRSGRNVYVLNSSGECKWEYTVGNHARAFSISALPGGPIAVGSEDGRVYGFNSRFTKIWDYKTGGWVRGVHVSQIQDQVRIAVGSEDRSVSLLTGDGRFLWRKFSSHRVLSVHIMQAVREEQALVLAALEDGFLFAYRFDGQLEWKYNLGDRLSTVYASDINGDGSSEILIGSANGEVHILTDGGDYLTTIFVNAWVRSVFAGMNDASPMIVIGASDGKAYNFDVIADSKFQALASNYWTKWSDEIGKDGVLLDQALRGTDNRLAAYALKEVNRSSGRSRRRYLDSVLTRLPTASRQYGVSLAELLPSMTSAHPEFVKRAVDDLIHHPSQSVRLSLVNTLKRLIQESGAEYFLALLGMINDSDARVRHSIVRAAASFNSTRPALALTVLSEATRDTDEWIQFETARGLADYLMHNAVTPQRLLEVASTIVEKGGKTAVFGFLKDRLSGSIEALFLEFIYLALSARILEDVIRCGEQLKRMQSRSKDFSASDSDIMSRLTDVVSTLTKVDRADNLQGQLQYALHAVNHLELIRREKLESATTEGGTALYFNIVSNWRQVISNALIAMENSAQVTAELMNPRLPQGQQSTIILNVINKGLGLAENITVSIEPVDGQTITPPKHLIPILYAGREQQLEFQYKGYEQQGSVRLVVRITYDDLVGHGHVFDLADNIVFLSGTGQVFKPIDPNPYVVGRPLQKGSVFFGREETFENIRRNLSGKHQDNILVLYGQRRTGKTSILYQLRHHLNQRFIPVLIDMQGILDEGLSAFLYTIAQNIWRTLRDQGIELTRPEQVDFLEWPGIYFEDIFLQKVFDNLQNQSLILMLDEFELLESRVEAGKLDAGVFDFLRHLMQHYSKLNFIFAGTHRLEEMSSDYWSFLFNIAIYIKVFSLDEKSARKLILEPTVESLEIDEIAVQKMLRLSAGHPHFLQLLCHGLVNYCNINHVSYVTIHQVNKVVEEVVETGGIYIDYIWRQSTTDEKLVLLTLNILISRDGFATFASLQRYLDGYNLPVNILASIRSLMSREIIVEESPGYNFKIGLVQKWLERNKTIDGTLRET